MFKTKPTKKINNLKPIPYVRLNVHTAWLLLIVQILNLLLVVQQLSFWMIGILALSLTWRFVMIRNGQRQPKRAFIILLAISGLIAITISGKQLGIMLAMLHLLSFAYALKTLELKGIKDFYQLILLGIFLVATSFIFEQSLVFSLIVAFVAVVNFSVLMTHFSSEKKLRKTFVSSGKLLFKSLPLAVVLFIFFPRLAPFWQMPSAKSAKTGLSDTVTPGDIANLARSNELAFRANFTDVTPSYSQLYWRALVLEQYQGKSWERSDKNKQQTTSIFNKNISYTPKINPPQQIIGQSDDYQPTQTDLSDTELSATQSNNPVTISLKEIPINYQVIAQPSAQHWLFGLDLAVVNRVNNLQSDIYEMPDFTLQSKVIINSPISYDLNSFINAPLNLTISEADKNINLSYPQGSNPRLEQYARTLRQRYSNDKDLVQKVLNTFSQQNYFYTLKPPVLTNNSLDEFFFDTKKGFCVHYASTFTFLMRAAGIPARVVTGYLGGEFNRDGNYYAIYQYDAHAWSEIWQEGIGWQRVDPTGAVDPQRVESGLSSELQREQTSLNNNLFSLSNYRHFQWINTLRLKFEAVDYQWTRWVIGFSTDKQINLLTQWFGKMLIWKTAVIIGVSVAGVMLCFLLFQGRVKTINTQSSWLILYQNSLECLKVRGLKKSKTIPVNDFSLMVKEKFPLIALDYHKFTQCFVRLEYQELTDIEQQRLIEVMKTQLNRIKIQLKSYPRQA